MQILQLQKKDAENNGANYQLKSIANRIIKLNIIRSSLQGIIATNSVFTGVLTNNIFIWWELENSLFKKCKLTDITFQSSNLSLATFDKCILSNIKSISTLLNSTKFINSEIYNCKKLSNLKATPIFVCQRRLYADYRSAKIAKKNMRKTYSQNLLNLAKASTDSTNLRFVTDYLINAANECKRHTGSLGMDPDLYNTLIFLRDKSTIND